MGNNLLMKFGGSRDMQMYCYLMNTCTQIDCININGVEKEKINILSRFQRAVRNYCTFYYLRVEAVLKRDTLNKEDTKQ